jgi:hypothetical protein
MLADEDDLDLRLEAKLGEELRRQLDPQLGPAAPYFYEHCAEPVQGRPVKRRRRWQFAAGLVAVAAACGAVIMTRQITRRTGVREEPIPSAVAVAQSHELPAEPVEEVGPSAMDTVVQESESSSADQRSPAADAGQPFVLGRALSTRLVAEGTLLVGRTPMRKVRRQWLERIEWFDPQNGARVQRIVPHEEIIFVPLPIN